VYIYMYIYIYICIYVSICISIYQHTYVYMYQHTYVYMYYEHNNYLQINVYSNKRTKSGKVLSKTGCLASACVTTLVCVLSRDMANTGKSRTNSLSVAACGVVSWHTCEFVRT